MSAEPYGNPPQPASPYPAVPPHQGAPAYPAGHATPSAFGEELPPQLLTLASAHNLGRLRAIRRPAKNIGYLVLFSLLGLLPLVFLFGPAWIGGIFLGVIIWPIVTIGLMRNPLVVRSLARKRIYFYDQGFVHFGRKGTLDVYRWDQISTVYQSIVRTSYNGVPTGTQYRYTVTRADGTTLKLTNFWADVPDVGHEINLRVSQAQLPAMVDGLARGRNIQFGDITVNAAGVTGKRGTVPWSEISKVAVRNGQVSLVRAGKFLPLSSTPASKIPNLPLFLHLATTYQQRHAQAS